MKLSDPYVYICHLPHSHMHSKICGPRTTRTKWISRMRMHMCIHMSLASCTDPLKAPFTDALKDMRCKGKVNVWIRVRMCIHTWYTSCADPLKDMRPKDKVNFLDPLGLNKVWIIKSLLATWWRRHIWCLIFLGHFPQTSPIIRGSVAKRDPRFKASNGCPPPCIHCADITNNYSADFGECLFRLSMARATRATPTISGRNSQKSARCSSYSGKWL